MAIFEVIVERVLREYARVNVVAESVEGARGVAQEMVDNGEVTCWEYLGDAIEDMDVEKIEAE